METKTKPKIGMVTQNVEILVDLSCLLNEMTRFAKSGKLYQFGLSLYYGLLTVWMEIKVAQNGIIVSQNVQILVNLDCLMNKTISQNECKT